MDAGQLGPWARGTRARGAGAIYVNHPAPCLWVLSYMPRYRTYPLSRAASGKVGPLYRGPFPAVLAQQGPGVAWLMPAGMPDKIRRPDQTLLAECSRVCRRGDFRAARGQQGAGTAGTADMNQTEPRSRPITTRLHVWSCLRGSILVPDSLLPSFFCPRSAHSHCSIQSDSTTPGLPVLFPSDE